MAVSKRSAALMLVLALSLPAHAAKPKTWKVNLKDADINALVSEVAEVTGKNFVVDPRVKGTITVISSKALSADELYELFLGVLSVNGFAAVPSGGAIKIVPDVTAKQFGVPVDVNLSRKGEALVTRVIRLENTNAVDMVPILRPMMPQFAHLAAVAGANALVLSDHANNIEALTQVISQLDGAEGDEIEMVPLRDARVDDVVAMLESLTGSTAAPSPGGGRDARQLFRVRVVADARSNRLLLKGDARGRKRLRELIATLDMPSERLGGVKVFRLRHASAKQVAEVLRGLVSGDGGRSSPASSGQAPAGGGAGAAASAPVAINANGIGLIADESLNALVVRADPAFMREIVNVIDQLDQRRSQVLIQAAIVEVSGDNAKQLGVQWAAGDPTKGVGLINFSAAGTSIANLASQALAINAGSTAVQPSISEGATLGFGKEETNANGERTFYGALIQALASVTNANLLSTPSIMTLDNQEAKIVVGQNVPFITGTSTSSSSTTSNPFQTIERQDVGITLKVKPSIGEGGTVRLEIEQEVSAVLPSTTGINSADLITSKRSIKTTVLADDGQTIVLGGLIRDDETKTVSKVPLLGDIPLLGYLFKATGTRKTKQNLLVFLQPTLLRDSSSAVEMSLRQYGAIRALDMSVSRNGKVSRLPENVEAIYQGYQQRPAAPAPVPSQEAPQAPVQEAPPQEAQPPLQQTPVAPAQP